MIIRDMRLEDRPRERFAEEPKSASLTDLVAILLRTGHQGHSVMEVAGNVINRMETKVGINGFEELDWHDLIDIKGIGPDKAITLCAAVELGRRLTLRRDKEKLPAMNTPGKVAAYFMEMLRHESREHFLVVYVNVKNRMLGFKEISIGGLSAATIDVKEAFKWGIRYKAHGLILLHNHPSGDPQPSVTDIKMTKQFSEAAKLLDMYVLDHVVIGDGRFVSLQEEDHL